ncbi:MAG: TRAP transporter substrate-binding protein DctP [Oscillospiraceae bacterium]|nr:TRAP transporter substrate-binding protein DctP [Oscillospiraceae bacterium]
MKKTRIIATILILVMALSLAACGGGSSTGGGAPAEDNLTYNLTYSYFGPEVIPPGQFVVLAAENVKERSNGRLSIDCYFNGTLLKTSDAITGCINGTADIVWVDSSVLGEVFPLSNVFSMPYMSTPPAKTGLDASFKELLATCPELGDELAAQGLMYLGVMPAGGFHLHGVSELFDSPSKLGGKTIDGLGEGGNLITALGGNGIVLDTGDYYLSLSTGLASGQLNHFASIHGFGADELLTTHVVFSNSKDPTDYDSMFGGGLYAVLMGTAMNLNSFNSLPADLQEILVDEFSRIDEYITPIDLEYMIKVTIDMSLERGDTFVFIDDKAREEWQPGIQSLLDKWSSQVSALGYDGMSIYNKLIELFAKYS